MARLWAIAMIGLALVARAPASAAPLEVYGRLPSLSLVRISPDGTMLASFVTDGEKRRLVIEAADTRKEILELNFGAVKARGLQWAGTGHVVASYSRTDNLAGLIMDRREFMQSIDVDWRRRTYRTLLYGLPDAFNVIYGLPEIRLLDGKPFAWVEGSSLTRFGAVLSLFRVDMTAGASMAQDVGSPETVGYAVDAYGRSLAQARLGGDSSRWSIDVWTDHWTPAARFAETAEIPKIVGLGRDGASIAVSVGADEDGYVTELKPDGSAWGAKIPVPDADGLIWDGATHKLIGEGHLEGDDLRYHFFDPTNQRAWDRVEAAFPNAQVALESFTDDHRRFVVHVDAPGKPPAFYLEDISAGAPVLIGEEYVGLDGAVASVAPVAFKAADGLSLGGYLTLPAPLPSGTPPRGLPLVVLVHGGPAARDEPGFDWWAQALASRGYAVLQVNYRGSSGLGSKLFSAGFGEWGRKMQSDLSDGVRAVVARGGIDASRVCIVGASYGGYAALAGATLDAGVYRCAVSVAGPSDLAAFLAGTKRAEGAESGPILHYWRRYMGPGDLDAISPAKLADRVTVPILLVHGKDDTVVPYEQSRIMANALRKAGKAFTFVTLGGEDHWLSQGATRLLMLRSVIDFLDRADAPGPQVDGGSLPPAK